MMARTAAQINGHAGTFEIKLGIWLLIERTRSSPVPPVAVSVTQGLNASPISILSHATKKYRFSFRYYN
jgi:hypothetical protein